MKLAGGVLGFLLVVGLGFVVYQLVKGKSNITPTGGNWLSKLTQSSTWTGGGVGAEPTAKERADLAVYGEGRTGRSHF